MRKHDTSEAMVATAVAGNNHQAAEGADRARRPLSACRLAANRANARKSTGPRTEAGKRASSQNARKTLPCPFTFQLQPHFADQCLHDALRRTASCPDDRARLLLINRCMLQAHELRWHALERTLFDTACAETDGSTDQAALWLAQQTAAAKGLLAYHRWIACRVNRVERCLAGLAAQSAHIEEAIEEEAPKTMAAGAGGSSEWPTLAHLAPSDLGPESTLPITYNDSGWSYGPLSGAFSIRVGAPQPPRPPQPPKPPTVGPVRGRYRLYLRCPATPEPLNEAKRLQSVVAPHPPAEARCTERSQALNSSAPEKPVAQPRRAEDQFEDQKDHAPHPLVLREQDALTVSGSMPAATPGRTQISNLPQQPELLHHHSPRHRRGPIPTTVTPKPTPTQSQPNLSSKDSHPSQPPVPTDENTVAPSGSIPERTQISDPSQQPELLHHHSPRHRRGPIPTTVTPEPTPTQSQPNLSSKDSHARQHAARSARNPWKRSQTAAPAPEGSVLSPMQSSVTHLGITQPIEPSRPTEPPSPSETAHSPPGPST